MKIDFSRVITGFGDKPLTVTLSDELDSKGVPVVKPMTLGFISATSLAAMAENVPIKKQKNGALALKVYDANEIELPIEDIAKIKKAIGEVQGAVIVAKTWEILENFGDKKEGEKDGAPKVEEADAP